MTDQTFGELRREDNYGWWGKTNIDFGGNVCFVEILIRQGCADEITQRQRAVFENGPEDEEEAKEIWGGEDLDDNGIGVRYVNEEIDEIGYKDMAF